MLNQQQQKLATHFQRFKSADRVLFSGQKTEFLTMCMAYVTQWRPNFDSVIKNPLSLQEMSTLILLASGKSICECADILGVAITTIKTYEKRTREKLNTYNRAHSFNVAVTSGFLVIKNPVI